MGKKRILIVDDEETIRILLAETLKPLGCEIETARNGEEAIRQIRKTCYDLIITDYTMPNMDGLELTRKINKINPAIPILVFSGAGPNEELLKSGALACIKKPLNIPEIQMISQVILSDALCPLPVTETA